MSTYIKQYEIVLLYLECEWEIGVPNWKFALDGIILAENSGSKKLINIIKR